MDAIVDYLSEILIHRGHFNVSDELTFGNIKNHRYLINNLLSSNPYLKSNEKAKKITYEQAIELLRGIDFEYSRKIETENCLLQAYEKLWDINSKNKYNSERSYDRKKYLISLFKKLIFDQLQEKLENIKYDILIEEDLTICYINNGKTIFPKTFLEIVDIYESIKSTNNSLFFRGHENSSYRLIPSIYRGNASFFEKELLYDAINLLPEEVRSASSTFEVLTKLQHFGTPTRLLDITTNPLVALYFACMTNSFNGEVLCFDIKKDKIKLFDSDTISILANLSKMPYDFNIKNSFQYTLKQFNDLKEIKELVHKIRSEKSYFENIIVRDDLMKSFFITSKLDNPRIIRQSGAFIICGMNEVKLSPSPEIFEIEKDVIKRIIISKSLKKDINKSLDVFNISSGSLFPDLSEVSRYIKSKYGL